ncbi:hypothetical protein EMPS_07396 [Entomortierella parvispora]|uniref:Uncharacterized protein n=1 Tax=Entomortierella parvispora TaxID=205924 RepID=A0A9P3LYE5_9FUNG|nr:hypothetical protein EMPS_07396 [Entomortierella parvispora]
MISTIAPQLPSTPSSPPKTASPILKEDLKSTIEYDKNSDDPLQPAPEQIQKLQQHRSNSTSSSTSSSSSTFSVSAYPKQLDLISTPPPLHCNTSPHRYNSDATNAILEDHSSPFTLSHATATEVQNIGRLPNITTAASKPSSRKNSLTSPTSANSTKDIKQRPVITASLPSSLFLSSSTASTTPYYTLATSRLPPNASTQVHYYTESPVMIEMKQFGATDASSIPSPSPTSGEAPATTDTVINMPGADYHDLVEESKHQHPFFRGWLQIPPSLAGRPPLTPEQEQRLRTQMENGPVQLMRAKPQRRPEVYGSGHAASGDGHSLPAAPPSAATAGVGGYFSKLWGMGGTGTAAVVESPATISNLGDEVIPTAPAPVSPTAIAAGGDRDSRRGAMGV